MTQPVALEAEASLSAVYDVNARAVFSFVRVRCGSVELAEEITAVTFEEAARRFAQSRGGEVDRSWLFTVARRRLIDHWRAVTRRAEVVDRLRTDAIVLPSEPRSTESLNDELTAALEGLPTRQRAALVLRYLDDFSVAEVADSLGSSYRATESLLARARHSLQAALEAMNDG